MIRLHVVVEGATEQTFVDELLYPRLLERGIIALPHSMRGDIRYSRLGKDLVLWMKSDPTAFVTTFFDYYGLVHDKTDEFPGKAELGKFDKAATKKQAIERGIHRAVEVRAALLGDFAITIGDGIDRGWLCSMAVRPREP